MKRPPTPDEAVELLRAEFYSLFHGMLDDFLETQNHEGDTNLDALIVQCMGGMLAQVGVTLIEPATNAVEDHAQQSGIEIVKA